MSLLEQINTELITATKNSDAPTRDLLRLVKTAIKNKEIALGHPLTDEEIVEVISKEIKQRQESIASFNAGNRPELAAQEQAEIDLLQKYLPEQMSEEGVRQLVDEAITQTGAQTKSDMGRVMGALMPKVKGKADGNLVSQLVREKLS